MKQHLYAGAELGGTKCIAILARGPDEIAAWFGLGPSLKPRIRSDDLSAIAGDDPLWDSVACPLAQLCHAIVCAAAPRAIAMGGAVIERQPH